LCPGRLVGCGMALFKWCCTCKQLCPISSFNRRAAAEDGLQSRCRDCSRAWYLAHREQHIANVARRSRRVRIEYIERLIDYLLTHPCLDCGERDITARPRPPTSPSSRTPKLVGQGPCGDREVRRALRELSSPTHCPAVRHHAATHRPRPAPRNSTADGIILDHPVTDP
jgi:hypothetical protein